MLALLTGRYTLEIGLIAGASMMLGGLAVDGAILVERLANPGVPMESTVHLAFFATMIVGLGLNLLFSSFLLAMLLHSRSDS